MAQDQTVSLNTDGIIITNSVEVTAQCGPSPQQPTMQNGSLNRSASMRSHNISISSISDLESESSVQTTSVDYLTEMQRPDIMEIMHQHQQQQYQEQNNATAVANQSPDFVPTKIASIAIKDSTDITFGNKTHYHGPVTIKQFMLDREKGRWAQSGVINGAFDNNSTLTTDGGGKDRLKPDILNPLNDLKKPLYKNWYLVSTIVSLLAVVVVSLVVVLTVTSQQIGRKHPGIGDGDDSRKNIPIDSNIDDVLSNRTATLRIVTRDEWIAQPASNPLEPLELPNLMVIITHTATEFCTTQAECTFRVRFIQTYHIESRNWDDIGYNWLVGGDGQVYEGRGWTKQGAHTKGFNKRSIAIAFIGTFNKVVPPERQLQAAQMLIEEGIRLGMLDKDYKLYGHRQLLASESPGDELYNIITKWPHWSDTPIYTQ